MSPRTLADIALAAGGAVVDAPDDGRGLVVDGPVVLDSRAAAPGALFVAVSGERTDGHDHAASAVASGAAAVLADRPVGVPAVVVPDGATAGLGRLARAHLAALPELTVVGVTGSSGKTSTKDLLAAVLERSGPTIAPPGSYNNELGLPLTALTADAATRWAVLEMGARGVGHIADLCAIARPRVGVVLNVGSAHVGEFGSREAVARAKGELVEALPAAADGGVAVLNGDDPLVSAMAERTAARVVAFGEGPGCDVRATGVRLDGRGRASFRLVTPEGEADVQLRLVGEHHVSNALAAASVGREAGLPVAELAAALSAATPRSRWRMEVVDRADGVTVINDAYNANPESMRAALKALASLGRAQGGARRTWAVLGEMRELGDLSVAEHDAMGRLAVRLGISKTVAVGEGAVVLGIGAREEGSWGDEVEFVAGPDEALDLLREQLRPGDIVLVKASRAVGLERVAAALLSDVPPAPEEGSS
ncbi:UDP-N-acetylmuramoyl-tripeptide--D-alanyl-D-alanine ligase [Motilibacter deserti]|uniref:UDP-N-acetylmuramoyl-tripeptide--D-alanyl-D-alanine ligase n=1 Tax=Motilibacter deserti TaxID=2714956 RepID=A0ABX0GR98_9ACTN|nr:UDP-N-acetylmuramoyl-tripeptide--D-alanyl-D-alanine ligase [Motilibacter deserti]NHC12300.1 UDP-N-acetylmuramoyl-tripeptide--D-alanyl-D-alanine ligase [Motilibacter deserti]